MKILTIVVFCVTLLLSGVTAYAGCLQTDVSAETYICDGDTNFTSTLTFEGATANAYETSIVITDPTADRTITVPNASGTVGLLLGTGASVSVPSTLSTNGVDVANSVWGGTNQLILEGATANDYETIITPTDATADRTITLPNSSGAVIISTLTTNAPDIANSISGGTNQLIMEGATADDYETIITPTDATADRTITIPNASGTVFLIPAVAEATNGWSIATSTLTVEGATADDYETALVFTDPTADRTITIPDTSGTVGLLLGTGASVAIPSTLSTNGVDVANSVWGGTNQLILEGATANDYETVITPTNATADRTLTLPDATGTVFLIPAVAEVTNGWSIVNSTIVVEGATADDYETTLSFTDPTADRTVTIPDATGVVLVSVAAAEGTSSWFFSGQDLKYEGTTADNYETILRGLADASADAILSAPQASGTLVVVGNGSTSWGVMLWGSGDNALDTGDEVCALAGLTCTYAMASSGGVPLANCQTDVGAEGTYISAFCR